MPTLGPEQSGHIKRVGIITKFYILAIETPILSFSAKIAILVKMLSENIFIP